MTIKQQLIEEVEEVIKNLGISDVVPKVEYPADPSHGDYSTNVAMVAYPKIKDLRLKIKDFKTPMELAEEIAKDLRLKISVRQAQDKQDLGLIEKVQVVKPGFINFWIANDVLVSSLSGLDSKKLDNHFTGKKISVEYTDPNPFKELHIGHLYSNIIGESLSRILEANGAVVWRADYYGDVGMHVARSIWGLKQMFSEDKSSLDQLAKKPLSERIDYLGKAYAKGSNAYSESEEVQSEVRHLNKIIYIAAQRMWEKKGLTSIIDYAKGENIDEGELKEVYDLYTMGRAWSLENFENQYELLGTKFDGYYPESIGGEKGYSLVMENLKKGIFVESEGAIIFPGEEYGLHTRVFINKLGLPTYEAKELGLAPWKYEDFPYDLSLIVTGKEISEYFKVLVTALKKINPELGEKTKPILHGMVNLPEGKMSSRSGNVISVNGLFEEATEKAFNKIQEVTKTRIEGQEVSYSKGGNVHPSKQLSIAEQVGIGAVRYALLKSSIGSDIVFDFEESVSFDGNSGPYIQYVYVRTQSVLQRAKGEGESGKTEENSLTLNASPLTLAPEERELLRLLSRFNEVVADAANRFAPNIVCTYLFELAQAFNLFYQKCPIIKSEEGIRDFRLSLTSSTGKVIKKGLNLLGIDAPARM